MSGYYYGVRAFGAAPSGGTASWVQNTQPIALSGSATTQSYPLLTSSNSLSGVVFRTYASTVTSVVGNVDGGGTVPFIQNSSHLMELGGETAYIYTITTPETLASVTITLAGLGLSTCALFEASSAEFDDSGTQLILPQSTEHTIEITTSSEDSLISAFWLIGGGQTVSSVRSGYEQIGSLVNDLAVFRSSNATGPGGPKVVGFTPSATCASNPLVFALRTI